MQCGIIIGPNKIQVNFFSNNTLLLAWENNGQQQDDMIFAIVSQLHNDYKQSKIEKFVKVNLV